VRAEQVRLGRQPREHQRAREALDARDVDKERRPPQAREGQAGDDALQREDGCAEDDHLGVLLAKVVLRGEVLHAEARGGGALVGAVPGEDGVAGGEHALGEELAKGAKAEDADAERRVRVRVGGGGGGGGAGGGGAVGHRARRDEGVVRWARRARRRRDGRRNWRRDIVLRECSRRGA
jgi:hypothetical protein